mmetsp:Transcript_32777/g.83564  ORF Transcript_32777/g.83564 Transcript_32777/m.83564 type:complete len:254 (+) Transcript_32777:2339-3100(+)
MARDDGEQLGVQRQVAHEFRGLGALALQHPRLHFVVRIVIPKRLDLLNEGPDPIHPHLPAAMRGGCVALLDQPGLVLEEVPQGHGEGLALDDKLAPPRGDVEGLRLGLRRDPDGVAARAVELAPQAQDLLLERQEARLLEPALQHLRAEVLKEDAVAAKQLSIERGDGVPKPSWRKVVVEVIPDDCLQSRWMALGYTTDVWTALEFTQDGFACLNAKVVFAFHLVPLHLQQRAVQRHELALAALELGQPHAQI